MDPRTLDYLATFKEFATFCRASRDHDPVEDDINRRYQVYREEYMQKAMQSFFDEFQQTEWYEPSSPPPLIPSILFPSFATQFILRRHLIPKKIWTFLRFNIQFGTTLFSFSSFYIVRFLCWLAFKQYRFKEKYHPEDSKPIQEESSARKAKYLIQFIKDLESGKFDQVVYDEKFIPKNLGQGSPLNMDESRELVEENEEIISSNLTQEDPLNSSTIVIKSIPPSLPRKSLLEVRCPWTFYLLLTFKIQLIIKTKS